LFSKNEIFQNFLPLQKVSKKSLSHLCSHPLCLMTSASRKRNAWRAHALCYTQIYSCKTAWLWLEVLKKNARQPNDKHFSGCAKPWVIHTRPHPAGATAHPPILMNIFKRLGSDILIKIVENTFVEMHYWSSLRPFFVPGCFFEIKFNVFQWIHGLKTLKNRFFDFSGRQWFLIPDSTRRGGPNSKFLSLESCDAESWVLENQTPNFPIFEQCEYWLFYRLVCSCFPAAKPPTP
jgi:hypothetical protein